LQNKSIGRFLLKTISIGKYSCLQQCSTNRKIISVLALDHRRNLRQSLCPQSPESITPQELSSFKIELVRSIAPEASAVLLDPQFGAAQCIAADVFPAHAGLLVSVEASGYSGDPISRISGILPEWGVSKIANMGANAVKLLVYYHPSSKTASEIEKLVDNVAGQCQEMDIPLFLEILTYSLDPTVKKLPPEERHHVVLDSANRLTIPGVDILKVEFPLDISAVKEDKEWAAACAELTASSHAPWVLLSASVPYDTFLHQVTIACENGASGVAVGRAVWQEATALEGEERHAFIAGLARERMARITALCNALGRPWTEVYQAQTVDENWYQTYQLH
jgi:tagatose 1,6-diphosphate aldolase